MEQFDFYKGLLDEISDGVYFVNRDREITYWNKAAEEYPAIPARKSSGGTVRIISWCTSTMGAVNSASTAVR